jgi:apolipoprotein N-acyltransferase
MSLYTVLWFGSTAILSRYIPPMVAWGISTIGYIFLLETYSLWIFGVLQGDPFAHPLIPLASYPRILHSIPILGRYGLLLFILIISIGITYLLKREWGRCVDYMSIGIAPFLYGFFNQDYVNIPSYIDSCAVITPSSCCKIKLDVGQEIAYKIAHAKKVRPRIQIFFMPESCYPFALNNDQDMISIWYQGLPDNTFLIIGAHRQEGKKLFNTVYCIKDGRIIHFYDKKYLFPLTEYLPSVWKTSGYNLFLTNKEPFCAGNTVDRMIDVLQAYPLICCELFFNPLVQHLHGQTIMACINEGWFMEYMQHLMYLRTVMIALEYQVSIIWVSHMHGTFIDKSGFQLPFFTL